MGFMINETLQKKLDSSINELEDIWSYIVSEGLQDEQEVLKFLDTINAISVRN